MTTSKPCRVCGQVVSYNARGQVLAHTREVAYMVNEPCPGATKGARP